jgi:DNA ligase (NAD+)
MNKEFLNQIISGSITASELSTEELEESLVLFNDAYRKGNELISDDRYDHEFKSELKKRDPDHILLSRVEPEPEKAFGDLPSVRHSEPMLSTENAFDKIAITKFINRVNNAALELGMENPLFKASSKLDGWSGKDTDNILSTRGSGFKGSDISRAFDRGVVPIGGRNQGVGEIVVESEYFEKYLSDDFLNSRNFMSAIISADEPNIIATQALSDGACRFVPYKTLYQWEGTAEQYLDDFKAIGEDLEANTPYDIDGIILEAINPDIKSLLGSTSHHHKWMLAVKLKKEILVTTVTGLDWTTGRTGIISPTAIYDEVFLSGSNLNRALAHHAQNVIDSGLGIGSKIEIQKAGQCVPKIERTLSRAEEVIVPSQCPCCSHDLVWDEPRLVCPNTSGCSAQTERSIIHFFSIMGNVNNFGPASISKIVAAGHDTLERIYFLTADDYLDMGFGAGETQRFINELSRSQTESVEDWRFLASFGLHTLGRGDSRKLLEIHPLETLGELTEKQIIAIHGFGKITAPIVFKELQANWPKIQFMMNLGFTLERTVSHDNAGSPIDGKFIVFTGAMQHGSRDVMKKQARALGATVQSSINKSNTEILVCGERVGEKKMESVRAFNQKGANIKIFSEIEYLDFLGFNNATSEVEIFNTSEKSISTILKETKDVTGDDDQMDFQLVAF